MLRKFQNFSPYQYVGKTTAKDLGETFVYYINNGFGIPWQFSKGYDLVF